MTLRKLRRRLTPDWLRTDARRQWRNVLFRRLGIARCYAPPILARHPELEIHSAFRFAVAHELLQNPRLTFIQIGAYDGAGEDDLHDLIKQHRLRGVMVEPQAAAFAKLTETYRDEPQLTLLEVAIAEQPGKRDLYCLHDRPSVGASFDRNNLLKHGFPAEEVVPVSVDCMTVDTALAAAGLEQVDVVMIDAEGYDYEIIRTIDFARARPTIVRFEYRHLSPADADDCLALLARYGYRFLVDGRDIIACRASEQLATPQAA